MARETEPAALRELQVLRQARWYKARTVVVERAGRRLVLKDLSGMAWPLRITFGRYFLGGEARACRRLAGLEGIPALVEWEGRDRLLLEYIEGQPLRKEARPFLAPDFFPRLEALVAALHARGVVHLDLGQRKNILVRTPGGTPAIIDFATALGGALPMPVGRILVRILGWIDRRGVLMHRLRYGPEVLDERERRFLRRANRWRALWIFNRPANPRRL